MTSKILYIFSLLIFCFYVSVNGTGINEDRGIEVVESSFDGMTIRFQPRSLNMDTVVINGQEYKKLDYHGAIFQSEPGDPLTPVTIATVGIPVGAKVTHSVQSSGFEEVSGMLLPQPATIFHNNMSSYRYFENNQGYNNNTFYPGKLIEISEPAFYRDQQIVKISFKAVHFNPAEKKIRLYKSITVRLQFHGNQNVYIQNMSRSNDDQMYKNVILNYKDARNWRKERSQILKKSSNIFDSGPWYKISIKNEGIYKVTGNKLVESGVDIKGINPRTIKIYNNGGKELPRNHTVATADNFIENAIFVHDGSDGVFDILDYILFYGKSVNNWEYNQNTERYDHYVNNYEDYNIYWLTWGGEIEGKRMQEVNTQDDVFMEPEPYFVSHYYFEQNINNFLNSGLHWFSRFFAAGNQYTFTAELPNAVSDDTYFKFRFAGVSSGQHTFTVYVNNNRLTSFSSYVQNFFDQEYTASGVIIPGYNNIRAEYNSTQEEAQAYLDWFEIHYRRAFVAVDDYLRFHLTPAVIPRRCSITNFSSNDIKVFDVTNFNDAKIFTNTSKLNNEVSFIDNNLQSAKTFIAITPAAYNIPESLVKEQFVNLRNQTDGADFIIITHDDFYDAVIPLAQHRETYDSLKTVVIKLSDIYKEFSWGLYDPTAIRNFIKYAYYNWTIKPSYVLLCGDGDYDYKNVISELDKNWIPPYETTELDEDTNRSSDDWFVTVSGNDNYPDLAIGRFPVRSVEETEILVNKIIHYEKASLLENNTGYGIDDWRNNVVMVGDDELVDGGSGNETIHTTDAENIIEHYVPNQFNKIKIYLSEYPAIRNVSYFSALLKPAASDAIINHINKGALILNYVGHGNPSTWSHEYVLYAPRDFNKMQNGSKLALWVAATCDFGRFDDPSQQSLAEDILTTERGGAIAVLASTRLVYAHNNAALNRAFFTRMFINQGTTERLGLALLNAKMDNGSSINDQKYLLLGDPTLRLNSPRFEAKITSIEPDTIKALSRIKVKGYIKKDNAQWNNFNGKILLKAHDSKKKRNYLTDKGSNMKYILPGNTIFRGVDVVKNGQFELNFIVPKDITYGGDLGRVNIYFANDKVNGAGYRDSLLVGGTSQIFDNEGPQIDIGLKDQDFLDQGFVNEIPVLKIEIADSGSGVNITGDIGHNVTMIVDDDTENKVILTDLFQYDEGSFTTGKIFYDFSNFKINQGDQGENEHQNEGLSEGQHFIEVKAWDNSNNSSLAKADFFVVSGSQLELRNVLNYPNPFSKKTTFSFYGNQDCSVTIKVYTVAGRLVHKFDEFYLLTNQLAKIEWDGRDLDGDLLANGVYFYKVIAKSNINGKKETKEVVQKLVVVR